MKTEIKLKFFLCSQNIRGYSLKGGKWLFRPPVCTPLAGFMMYLNDLKNLYSESDIRNLVGMHWNTALPSIVFRNFLEGHAIDPETIALLHLGMFL